MYLNEKVDTVIISYVNVMKEKKLTNLFTSYLRKLYSF